MSTCATSTSVADCDDRARRRSVSGGRPIHARSPCASIGQACRQQLVESDLQSLRRDAEAVGTEGAICAPRLAGDSCQAELGIHGRCDRQHHHSLPVALPNRDVVDHAPGDGKEAALFKPESSLAKTFDEERLRPSTPCSPTGCSVISAVRPTRAGNLLADK
jgi:hypothetical protein